MRTWVRRRLSERRHDERGAILVLSALFLIVMVLAAALAVDIGLEGVDKRNDHKIADLASLDGARAMSSTALPCIDAVAFAAATLAANQSALRNGFNPLASGNSLTLDVGTWNPVARTYTPSNPPGLACTANAVHVVVGSVTHYKFQPFSQTLSAQATATANEVVAPQPPPPSSTTSGGFKVGSFLANMDSTQAALMDEVVCQALARVQVPNVGALASTCPKFNLSAAGWQGLGAATVTMDALGKALAANGVIGSPDQVGGATVQADQLFKATGDALTNKGDTADATVMYNLGQGVSGQPDPVVINKVVDQQGSQGSAFAATQPVNVADLVVGSATTQIANGTNALAVLDTGISVPNASSGLNLALVEAPRQYDGPLPSPVVTTSQLSGSTSTKSGLSIQLNSLPVSIPGLAGATLSGTVTVAMTGAGAQAQMLNPVCLTSVLGSVTPQPFHTAVTGTGLSLNLPLLPSLGIGVTAAQDVTSANATKTFNYSADFNKDWRVGATSLQLSGLNYSVNVNGSIPLGTTLAAIQQQVASTVNSTVAQFDGPLSNLYRELGLAVGGADYTATHYENLDAGGNNAPCPSATTTTTATTVPGPVLVR